MSPILFLKIYFSEGRRNSLFPMSSICKRRTAQPLRKCWELILTQEVILTRRPFQRTHILLSAQLCKVNTTKVDKIYILSIVYWPVLSNGRLVYTYSNFLYFFEDWRQSTVFMSPPATFHRVPLSQNSKTIDMYSISILKMLSFNLGLPNDI